jgi:hypothetical protein
MKPAEVDSGAPSGSERCRRLAVGVAIAVVSATAFLVRHWAALVFVAVVVVEALVFVPRHMFGAMIAGAIVAAGAVVGHWLA